MQELMTLLTAHPALVLGALPAVASSTQYSACVHLLPAHLGARLHFSSSHPAQGSHYSLVLFLASSNQPVQFLLLPKTQQLCFQRDGGFAHVSSKRLCWLWWLSPVPVGHRNVPSLPGCLWTVLKLSDNLDGPSPQPTVRFLIDSTNESADFQHPLLDPQPSKKPLFLFNPFRGCAFDKIYLYFAINRYSQLFLWPDQWMNSAFMNFRPCFLLFTLTEAMEKLPDWWLEMDFWWTCF